MTNRQVFLMAIRAACIKAHGINSHRAYEIRSKINSPRLADVLLAIDCGRNESCDYGVKDGEFLIHPEAEDVEHIEEICWNLRPDDLEQQSDETISFIASLV